MEKYASDLLAILYSELQEVPTLAENNLQQFEKSFFIADAKIKQLKEFTQSYSFKNEQEEIHFFKEIKPLFQKEVIYFTELFNIEWDKPIASINKQKRYYEKALDRIMDFFDQNRELYNYYRSGKDELDNIYFVRSEIKVPLRPVYTLDLETSFSTPYSRTLAQLQAYEQVCSYINHVLYGKEASTEELIDGERKHKPSWSGSKAALIELAIALYYSGSVNFGKGGFKKFISELESFFNIQLGNVYRVFISMVLRKKDPTPFLHILEETVKRKLDEKVM